MMGSRHVLKRRLPRAAATLLLSALVGLAPGLTGCYGNFPLTKLAFKVNGSVSPKPVRSVVFWAFLFFPVYSTAVAGDALVLNVIEYWLGARVDFARVDDGTAPGSVRFVRTPAGWGELRDADGRLLGLVVAIPQGALTLADSDGHLASGPSAEQVGASRGR